MRTCWKCDGKGQELYTIRITTDGDIMAGLRPCGDCSGKGFITEAEEQEKIDRDNQFAWRIMQNRLKGLL